jgi:predicted nucleotidyltransferase
MGIKEILGNKKAEILEIARKHGVKDIRVFGSVARGEATEKSDVDFLIQAGPKVTPWFPGGLVADLEDLLSRKVDVVTEKGLHPYLRDRVLKEAMPL